MVSIEGLSFNARIAKCIDAVLASNLGESSKEALLYSVAQRLQVDRKQFLKRPVEFVKELKAILGEGGYDLIEKRIVADIKAEFNLENDRSIKTFPEAVEHARVKFLQFDS